MPTSSTMHTPALMGEDDKHIKYGCDPEQFDAATCEEKPMGDGVTVKMAKRKSDGQVGVMSCEFAKPAFNSESAGAWMKKQNFSIQPADLFRVDGVEIFSTGLWNGKQISDKDLTTIAENYSKTKGLVRPALKLGHDDDQKILQQDGLPAAGWVENVRKVGSKLVADFVDIPKKIYQLIVNRAYRKVSCEIYNNLDIEGTTYPKLLGAVALLGSDLPGVLNLNDIISLYASANAFAPVEKFAGSGTHEVMFKTSETHNEDPMPNDADQFKAKAESAEKERDAAKAEAAKAAQDVEKFKKEAEEAKAEAARLTAAALSAAKKAKIEAFVTQIVADQICSKSMVPFVEALLGEEKEKYSIDKGEFTKEEALKELLKLGKDAAKVNFKETTANSDAEAQDKDLDSQVEKYAQEHKVSYGAAYRAVTKGKKLSAKPLEK